MTAPTPKQSAHADLEAAIEDYNKRTGEGVAVIVGNSPETYSSAMFLTKQECETVEALRNGTAYVMPKGAYQHRVDITVKAPRDVDLEALKMLSYGNRADLEPVTLPTTTVRPQPCTAREMAMKLMAENECRPGSTFTHGAVQALLETAFSRGAAEVQATTAHYEQLILDTIASRPNLPDVHPDEGFTSFYLDQIEWSLATFGPGARTKGIINHARKELHEIKLNPYDLMEWIDLAMLAFDGFHRHGGDAHMALELLRRKQAKNIARVWPDWREFSEDVAIEHDRSGE